MKRGILMRVGSNGLKSVRCLRNRESPSRSESAEFVSGFNSGKRVVQLDIGKFIVQVEFSKFIV